MLVIPTEAEILYRIFWKKNNPSLLISEFSVKLKNLKNEKEITPDELQKMPKGEGVDVWLKKDGVEY